MRCRERSEGFLQKILELRIQRRLCEREATYSIRVASSRAKMGIESGPVGVRVCGSHDGARCYLGCFGPRTEMRPVDVVGQSNERVC